MNVIKIAAFSHGQQGGNPAGVVLSEPELPTAELMQTTAADVGFSVMLALLHPIKLSRH